MLFGIATKINQKPSYFWYLCYQNSQDYEQLVSNITCILLLWLKYIVPVSQPDILEVETNPQKKRT